MVGQRIVISFELGTQSILNKSVMKEYINDGTMVLENPHISVRLYGYSIEL